MGFAVPNGRNFWQFYLVYQQRILEIRYPAGSEFRQQKILSPVGRELRQQENLFPAGKELGNSEKQYPVGTEFATGFHSDLSWSHYRALMRVDNAKAPEI